MAQFPRFNAHEYLEGSTETLATLGGLGAKILPFQKRVQALDAASRERYEERAAIMEYDGKLPRAEAEELAYAEIIIFKDKVQ